VGGGGGGGGANVVDSRGPRRRRRVVTNTMALRSRRRCFLTLSKVRVPRITRTHDASCLSVRPSVRPSQNIADTTILITSSSFSSMLIALNDQRSPVHDGHGTETDPSSRLIVNSLPKTVTRQRRDCDLNPGPSAPESRTLTTRLPSHPLL